MGNTLCVELPREIQEHLVRNPSERRPDSRGSRQLSDEHRRLLHDGVDEQPDVHSGATSPAPQSAAPGPSMVPTLAGRETGREAPRSSYPPPFGRFRTWSWSKFP